ncbi:ATP-binding cassette domain-containing protein [Sodalis sp. C49]|uniref:ATP-binding cassette domain-containing protein n=1 Tax=Sodalis sp. C49 TaxID=3228929 RepID=UPI003965C1E3
MLATEALCFSWQQDQPALCDLTLDFSRGRVTGLIGANGCGKSTLFMNLLGLQKPQSGRVLWRGKPLDYDKRSLLALRQQVVMVFQEPDHQLFYTDIDSDIAFALRNLGVNEAVIQARLAQALTLVGANGFRHRPIQYLSHGQKKRVAIAGALVMQSDYLLLDEPTAGLDPQGREAMIGIIQRIAAQGRHVIIASHDIDLIYHICDYIYVMAQGRLLAEGSEREVFQQAAMLARAGLSQPWLIKAHTRLGMPLVKTEDELFAFYEQSREAKV